MFTAKSFGKWAIAGIAAATLVACGGGEKAEEQTKAQAKAEVINWKKWIYKCNGYLYGGYNRNGVLSKF